MEKGKIRTVKTRTHYTVKNAIGGSFCKRCMNWSSEAHGLRGEVCEATKKEAKENMKNYRKKKLSSNPPL